MPNVYTPPLCHAEPNIVLVECGPPLWCAGCKAGGRHGEGIQVPSFGCLILHLNVLGLLRSLLIEMFLRYCGIAGVVWTCISLLYCTVHLKGIFIISTSAVQLCDTL